MCVAAANVLPEQSHAKCQCGLPLLLDRLKQSAASCKVWPRARPRRRLTVLGRKRRSFFGSELNWKRSTHGPAASSVAPAWTATKTATGGLGRSLGLTVTCLTHPNSTFVSAYSAFLKTHDFLSENHLRFAGQVNEMSEQLMELSRESERVRKNGKEVGSRLERTLTDSEQAMDKARVRFDAIVEELERCLVTKAGESVRQDPALLSYSQSTNGNGGQAPPPKRTFGKAMSKLKSTRQGTSKNEDELRARVTAASEAYRREVSACQTVRRDHWVNHIPRLLRQLKESVDEIENGTSFHLSRYAYLYEHLCMQDGATMAPPGGIEEGPGLKAVVEAVDNREDFKQYMEMYHVAYLQSPAAAKGPAKRGQGMLDEDGYVNAPAPQRPGSALQSQFSPADYQPKETMSLQHREPAAAGPSNPKAVFGVTLNALMDRDGLEVPRVLEECAAVIEAHGTCLPLVDGRSLLLVQALKSLGSIGCQAQQARSSASRQD
jgi:hypothetical protein